MRHMLRIVLHGIDDLAPGEAGALFLLRLCLAYSLVTAAIIMLGRL